MTDRPSPEHWSRMLNQAVADKEWDQAADYYQLLGETLFDLWAQAEPRD